MALTTIKIDEAQTAAENIKTSIENQRAIINAYPGYITQLQAHWNGEGARAFMAAFGKFSPNVKKKFEEIDAYNSTILKLLARMREADKNAAAAFEAV